MTGGYPIVLTADRTLMADYPCLLDGMMATIQTTAVPGFVMRRCLSPKMPLAGGLAARAPLGIRRIEAALAAAGAGAETVAVVAPRQLDKVVGPATRVIGLASGDPLGKGMTNTTMVAMSGGKLYTRKWYAELCGRIERLRARAPKLRLLAGGPGAWQLAGDPVESDRLGIDAIYVGYAESDAPDLFARMLSGEPVERVITSSQRGIENIPPITAASSMGVVEVSRGCGRGCGFCTIATEPMVHLPVEQIVADVRTNVAAGLGAVSLISEDLFRYGSPDTGVAPEKLIEMLEAVQSVPGVRMIQVDHINISSVMQFTDKQLRCVRNALRAENLHEKIWVNLGVESASGELLAANGMAGKLHPFRAAEWPDLCEQAVARLTETGFVPMVSVIMGLDGETDEHVTRTLDLIGRMEGNCMVAFPIFYAPINPAERAFGIDDMTAQHWELFKKCYGINFRWIPSMFWDNQSAAGAPLWRKLFIQAAGRGQKYQWAIKFLLAGRKARR